MQCKQLSQSMNKMLELLGEPWTLAIISILAREHHRFCELQRLLENLNPSTLTARLKKLEKERLVYRAASPEDKVAVVYGLTPKGRSFIPVLESLELFAKKHY